MLSTTQYNTDDIILVRYPFSDLTAVKKRPALIISSNDYHYKHRDVVILAVTSVKQSTDQLKLRFWQNSGLLKPSWLKPAIATISIDLIDHKLGRIDLRDMPSIRRAIKQLISRRFI